MKFDKIVVLTGAGLSAESGLGTFRGHDGLWDHFSLEDVATPEGFARNPVMVHDFYNMRRFWLKEAKPNAAHVALARLEEANGSEVLTVTQNIDWLHEAAGTHHLIHMHGELGRALCARCGTSLPWLQDLSLTTACPVCHKAGFMRPDVVWFGEMPREMERIHEALRALRPLRFDRHERDGLSGRGLRRRGRERRRPYGRAQSRSFGRREPVRRSPLRAGDRDRAGLRREAAQCLALEVGDHLHMGREQELIDRHDAGEPVAAVDQ